MLFSPGRPQSPLTTWDPKPDAPRRGCAGAVQKADRHQRSGHAPSPRSSRRWRRQAERFSLIRSVYPHGYGPCMNTGHQNDGRPAGCSAAGFEHPHAGCVLGYVKGPSGGEGVPAHVLLPRPMGRTGRPNLPHGQNGRLPGQAARFPFVLNADPADKNFKVPDLLPPRLHFSAVRADRRQKDCARPVDWRGWRPSRGNAQARQLDENFDLALSADVQPPGPGEAFALEKEPEIDARNATAWTRLWPVVSAGATG